MTMIRTWNDEDYDDYVVKVSTFKDEIKSKLKDDSYTLTEVIDSA